MAYEQGVITNGGGRFANQNLLLKIKELAEANGWVTLRYDDSIEPRELILKGEGLSGTEEIFIGFRSYQSVGADYYNITAAAFVGYIPSNPFTSQPGYYECGVPTHNLSIGYTILANPQRIALGLKVGTPVYVAGYAGKILPFARPDQYSYPVAVGGMFVGPSPTRFSDTTQSIPFKGSRGNFVIRNQAGAWVQPYCWPWTAQSLTGENNLRDTGGIYPCSRVILHNNNDTLIGALDGISHVPGFGNAVENTIEEGGTDHFVLQDAYRTGFDDYFAMELA